MQIIDRSSNQCNAVELVDDKLQPLQVRGFYSHSHGQLKVPKGFYKLTNTVLEQAHLTYELSSLVEMEIPETRGDNELEEQRKTSNFFWLSPHYRMEFLVSYDGGKRWTFRSAMPLKRPKGFPVQTVRLLDFFSDTDIYRLTYGMILGVRFRSVILNGVSFGIPKNGLDSCVIHCQGVCEETAYESVQQLIGTSTATFVTERQPVTNNAFSQLTAARVGRKTLSFRSPSAATVTFTVRYGGVAETGAQTFTISGGQTVVGRSAYEGEVSFSQVTNAVNVRLEATEIV
jgi:hypothetical protein